MGDALPHGGRTGLRAGLLAPLGLLALALFVFRDLIFGERVLFERDLHLVWYSEAAAFVRSIAAGSWPVWDTTTGFGQPLWADPGAEVLYPFKWLLLAVDPGTYYTLFVVVHVSGSALGLFALSRRLGLSRLAAMVAAGVWMTSGPLLSELTLWHHLAGSCWIPWVLLASERALSSRRLQDALVWGVVFSFQILAGSADMCALSLFCVGVLALPRLEWRAPGSPSNRGILWTATAAQGVALAVGAAVWLPALDAVHHSARSAFPEATRLFWSVHPFALLQCVLPILWDQVPLRPELKQAFFEGREPFLRSLYLGGPAVALALTSLALPRDRRRWPFLAIALVGLAMALGRHTPAYGVATALLPPLRIFRYPEKAMIVVGLACSVLAGLGLQAWEEGLPRRRWIEGVVLPLLALGLLGAGGVGALALRADTWGLRLFSPETGPLHDALLITSARWAWAAGLTLVTLGLAVLRVGRPPSPWPAVLVGAICVLDLTLAHARMNWTAPREYFRYRPPVLDALHLEGHRRLYVREYLLFDARDAAFLKTRPYSVPRDGLDDRGYEIEKSLAMDSYLYPPTAGRWGIEGSYDADLKGLAPSATAALVHAFLRQQDPPAQRRFLELGAVGSVVTLQERGFEDLVPALVPTVYKEPIRSYRIPSPLPRAYAVLRARVLDGPEALKGLLDPGFDFRSEVILPEGAGGGTAGGSAESRVVDLRPDRVAVEATLGAPGYVVLVDAWDPGWRVSVDGRPAALLRANTAFRAVAVPEGRHDIVFVYRPWAVSAGLALSALAALLTTCGLAWGRPRL